MDEDKQKKRTVIAIVAVFLILVIILMSIIEEYIDENIIEKANPKLAQKGTFHIIASSENADLEEIIQEYAKTKKYNIDIEYAGTIEIMEKINNKEKYDAVWISNSIWLYMIDNGIKITNSKYTSINPVIFGITKTKAEELGWTNKTVYTKDIVDAISKGKLKFSMSNPISTNSGATAYLGLLSTLAGNPEVLKRENLEDKELKENLKTLFAGLERSSGSEEFLEELFFKGDYEAIVTYESSIININKKLESQGKETLYAIYPVDGVSIADSPFAYIDNKNENAKEIFLDLQKYLLSNEGQKLLQEKGRRTWYGGIKSDVDKSVFNPEWGIDTTKYISPTKYPSTEVIKLALNLYQTEFRKPIRVAFCLDYSGSMTGQGYTELVNAMNYILSEEAAEDFLQFSERDKIDIIPFGSVVMETYSTSNGSKTENLLAGIKNLTPNGSTALYPAVIEALDKIKNENLNEYNVSIIVMTDGEGNRGTYKELENAYKRANKDIPIYSIMFGSATETQLQAIADLSNAKIFDGKKDLKKAFKEVRGYN